MKNNLSKSEWESLLDDPDVGEPMIEREPPPVPANWPDDWQASMATDQPWKVVLQSSYGPHDERLVMDGNFGDPKKALAYGQKIAKALNASFSTNRPQGKEQMVSIPASLFSLVCNALRRDAEAGRQVRGEMLQELESKVEIKDAR